MKISEAITKVARWLERNQVPLLRDDDKGIISGLLPLDNNQSSERYIVDFRDDLTIGYSFWRLPEKYNRGNLVEFMALLNFTLLRGCFEFDDDNSVLRYKYLVLNHSIEYGDDDVIRGLIILPCVMMYRYRKYFKIVLEDGNVKETMERIQREAVDE